MRAACIPILVCSLTSSAHAAIAGVFMSGFVTQAPPMGQELPAPWNAAGVGDAWSLTLTFEDSTPGFPAGAQTMFRGFARSYEFTLDGVTASGTLPPAPGASQAFLQDAATIDYFGFDFAIMQGQLRFGAGLTDLQGAAFPGQSMLPTSFATEDFEIRDAGVWRANGGSPAAAMRFSVVTVTPAPASGILGAAGLAAVMRRRRTRNA